MKNKQREVGVQLPFIVKDTRTYQELCKDAKEAIESTAEDWIPRFCMAIKRQHPLISSDDIKKRVVKDWSNTWKGSTINNYWPPWMKSLVQVEAAKAREAAKKKNLQNKMQDSKQETQQQGQGESESQQEQTLEQKERTKAEQKHDTLVDNICGNLMVIAELISGYKEEEILNLNNNLKLISETKQFRFNLVKALSPLNIEIVYRDTRRAAMILNAFLEQLDDELTSRKRKASLTSE